MESSIGAYYFFDFFAVFLATFLVAFFATFFTAFFAAFFATFLTAFFFATGIFFESMLVNKIDRNLFFCKKIFA